MTDARAALPEAVLAAARDRRAGASELARRAIGGLLEVAGDRALLEAGAAALLAGQPAMAPIWHVALAARAADPAAALDRLGRLLEAEAGQAAAAAAAWLRARGGPVRTVSHSSLVDLVLARLGAAAGGDPARGEVAVVGADAVGPSGFLNAAGTSELVARLPAVVVTTSITLVPERVFAGLTAPGFERVSLGSVTAVALGGEVVPPGEAGRRAARAG
jgi:hypothetical protein